MQLSKISILAAGLLLSPVPKITLCQAPATRLPAGTPLSVRTDRHLLMRVGQPIQARLVHPVYANDTLLLPENTVLTGTVVQLLSDHSRRVRSRFNGDFTPFHIPVIKFTQIVLANGTSVPITTETATDGAPIIRLIATSHKNESFLHQQYDAAVQLVRDQITFFIAPGKGDRLIQLFYHQLPYHPQRIEENTAWTVQTAQPLVLPQSAVADRPITSPTTLEPPLQPQTWNIQANLDESLSSATARTGEPIHATVAEPIFDPDHTVAIPQGATIVGAVTHVSRSRTFGRSGSLRFTFRQIVLPSGHNEPVVANLSGADSANQQKLTLDSEGDIKPRPQDKIIVPVILLGLASAPLDTDPGDNDEWVKNGAASNSLGLAGFITGLTVNRAAVSAGFGYYGASLSIYDRWIKRGTEVTFPRGTRIILQVTPHHSALPSPATAATNTH